MNLYLQTNISEKDRNEINEVCHELGIHVIEFYHIPFDTSYPEIDDSKSAFVYASSSVTNKIIEDQKPGVFCHTNNIDMRHWFSLVPEMMLNYPPLYVGKMADVPLLSSNVFIRPCNDSKWMAGQCIELADLSNWIANLKSQNHHILDEDVIVSNLAYIENEYRLFFVNYQFSTGSLYKQHGELKMGVQVPDDIISFALEFVNGAKSKLPNSFVVDVASYNVRHTRVNKIIEVNGINNSGFYASDKMKLFSDLKHALVMMKPH